MDMIGKIIFLFFFLMSEYKPPSFNSFVPYDGALVITTCKEDLDNLIPYLNKKIIPICDSIIDNNLSKDHIDLCLSFLKLQPQTIMLICWKVNISKEIQEYANNNKCILISYGKEKNETELARIVMDKYHKRNKELKPKWVTWKNIPNYKGELTVWHKLTSKAITNLKNNDNCTHIVSLLGDKENPSLIQNACERNNITWIHINIQGAKLETLLNSLNELQNGIINIRNILQIDNTRTLIHCSAGVHRTGTFTYGLLRSCGFNIHDTNELLYEIRPVTARQVGNERIHFAENNLVLPL